MARNRTKPAQYGFPGGFMSVVNDEIEKLMALRGAAYRSKSYASMSDLLKVLIPREHIDMLTNAAKLVRGPKPSNTETVLIEEVLLPGVHLPGCDKPGFRVGGTFVIDLKQFSRTIPLFPQKPVLNQEDQEAFGKVQKLLFHHIRADLNTKFLEQVTLFLHNRCTSMRQTKVLLPSIVRLLQNAGEYERTEKMLSGNNSTSFPNFTPHQIATLQFANTLIEQSLLIDPKTEQKPTAIQFNGRALAECNSDLDWLVA